MNRTCPGLWGCLLLLCWACQSPTQPIRPDIFPASLDLLVKDPALYEWMDWDSSGVTFYPSPEARAAGLAECRIYRDEFAFTAKLFQLLPADTALKYYQAKGMAPWPDSLRARLNDSLYSPAEPDGMGPLSGWRIALDPGHVAGDFPTARLEGKYVEILPSAATHFDSIRIYEAQLNLATAHLIRDSLEQLGATVLMSRTEPGIGAMGLSYADWRESKWDSSLLAALNEGDLDSTQYRWWQQEAEEKLIMSRFFTQQDLRARARKINAFQPHLTLIIHYNVDSPNWERRNAMGMVSPTNANYCMAFVPGAFMAGELRQPADRLAFLRILLGSDLRQSIRLSAAFVQHSQRLTGVPVIPESNALPYLNRACILTPAQGVYARNLSLTRLINGPLCYGESLCQDNLTESLQLSQANIEVEGVWVSDRVQAVAQAYLAAIREFVRN